jgi:hypothetical protein
MNITDIFVDTTGQLNWDAISTIANIILAVVLIIVTLWNVIQFRKQTGFMKRDRLAKEMECLVGKLYSKRMDKNIFFKLSSERRNSNGEGVKEHFRFWDKIEQYMYLGPPELRSSLNKYIESKSGTDKKYEKAEGKSGTDKKYEKAEVDLIKEIENRRADLTDKIESSRGK